MILNLPSRQIPCSIPDDTELFIIGDIHGRSLALSRCLSEIARTPTVADTRRIIVLLGDLIDRGPDSLGVIQQAMEAHNYADLVHILPGNHELMMLDVLDGSRNSLWLLNGGMAVLDELNPEWRGMAWRNVIKMVRDGLPDGFEQRLRDAPSHLVIGDLLCVHAGLHPDRLPEQHLLRDRPHATPDHWATIRYPALNWRGGWDWNGRYYTWGNRVVIHGHTPAVRCAVLDDPKVLRDCDGIDEYRALCLDGGASAYDQIAWARIWRDGGETRLQIYAASGAPRADGDLYGENFDAN
ncbi:metallophosphoesterase [Marivivens niveibacter]|nr:metallophosphoesterase [Marivivens niveibacter]